MKLLKRFLKGLLILLIITSIAAIVYVLQWKEEQAEIKPPKKVEKKAEQHKTEASKAAKEKLREKSLEEAPVVSESIPRKEKEKTIANAGKIPLRQRQVAIIIDDIGNDLKAVKELLEIKSDITFAVMPFCRHTRDAAEAVHKAHREILLHLPMEPLSYPHEKPGNGALFTDMNDQEILFQLDKDLTSVPYVSGVNNHMGSKFMGDEEKLKLVFIRLRERKLFFIDSRTTPNSKALSASEKSGLPLASRRIFLDNKRDYKEIYKILTGVARDTRAGDFSSIIIIGHPYPETIRAIRDSSKILRESGISIVPVSKLIKDKANSGSS